MELNAVKAHDLNQHEERLSFAQQLNWFARFLRHEEKSTVIAKEDIASIMNSIEANSQKKNLMEQVSRLLRLAGYEPAVWKKTLGASDLPILAIHEEAGLMVVYGQNIAGEWLIQTVNGRSVIKNWIEGTSFTSLHSYIKLKKEKTARSEFVKVFRQEPRWIYFAVLASFIGSCLTLLTSLYSMQIYDRVIGSHSVQTLTVLTIGVIIAYLIDLPTKIARSVIVDNASANIDRKCATIIFSRLLAVRLDQYQGSVGTLAAQVKSYESVRSFAVALILFLTTDAPFALLFLGVISIIGGPLVALVPVIFLVVLILIGIMSKRKIIHAAHNNAVSGNKRQGLLVEAIEGAETLKATGAQWRIMGMWNALSAQAIAEFLVIKHLSDRSSYLAAFIQQISYVSLIAVGAYIAIESTTLTTGGLVACSILSGRVLAPMGAIPGLLVQWAHAKTALDSLDSMFKLKTENEDEKTLLAPETVRGSILASNVVFHYPGQVQPMRVKEISISPGEKVAILGEIGSGKSTLLRAIAGLTKSSEGQVLLDGMDILQIAPEVRAEKIGYLPQSITLFSGTLKENLCSGLPQLSETRIREVCDTTGLSKLINSRSEGLHLRIMEGNSGLSGGQRQLIGITRLLLQSPALWLLDEPTSAMDDGTEKRCIEIFKDAVKSDQTLIIVTHKPSLLDLVDRIIVVSPAGVVLDGPKNEILKIITARPKP